MMNASMDTLEDIIARTIAPAARGVDETGEFPRGSLDELARLGLFGLMIPKKLGGVGGSAEHFLDVCRRLGAACASTAMAYVMHVTSVGALIHQSNESQRNRYLRPVIEGRWLATEAISEPGSGSQWWSLSSTASRLPDGRFRIRARKSFATSAGHADLYMVSTRAPDTDDARRHALFAIEADNPGITHGPWDALGLRGSSSGPMSFELDVDEEAMIFGSGSDEGLRIYNEANQPLYHLGIGAVYLGITDAMLHAAVERIRGRSYSENASGFGAKLSDFPVARRHIGEMAISRLALEGTAVKFARDIDVGMTFDSMAVPMTALKVLAAQTAASVVARRCKQAAGPLIHAVPCPLNAMLGTVSRAP